MVILKKSISLCIALKEDYNLATCAWQTKTLYVAEFFQAQFYKRLYQHAQWRVSIVCTCTLHQQFCYCGNTSFSDCEAYRAQPESGNTLYPMTNGVPLQFGPLSMVAQKRFRRKNRKFGTKLARQYVVPPSLLPLPFLLLVHARTLFFLIFLSPVCSSVGLLFIKFMMIFLVHLFVC